MSDSRSTGFEADVAAAQAFVEARLDRCGSTELVRGDAFLASVDASVEEFRARTGVAGG
jgi:hypothetical protein